MDTLSAFFKLCFIAHWMHVFMCLVTISNCHVSRVHCIISNSPLEVDFHSKKKVFVCMRYIRINIHVHLRVRNRVVLFSSILLSFFLAPRRWRHRRLLSIAALDSIECVVFFLIIAYIFSFFFFFVIFFLFPPLTSTFNIFSYYSSKSSRRRHFNMLFTFQIRIMLSTLPFFVLLFHLLFLFFIHSCRFFLCELLFKVFCCCYCIFLSFYAFFWGLALCFCRAYEVNSNIITV